MGIGAFYWACLKYAFGGRFWHAEKWSGGAALLLTFVGVLLELKDSEFDVLLQWGPMLVFVAIFFASIATGLVVAPWAINQETETRVSFAERRNAEMSRRLEPAFRMCFQPDAKGVVELNYERRGTSTKQTYVRGHVEGISDAPCPDCVVYLVRVEREEDGEWVDTGFSENLVLPWSLEEDATRLRSAEVTKGVPKYFDIATTVVRGMKARMSVARDPLPDSVAFAFRGTGKYRLHLRGTGAGQSRDLAIEINWQGVKGKLGAVAIPIAA